MAIIVPQEELGACTPTPRKESADSSSMLLATLRVKKTMIVEPEVGQQLAEHHPQRPAPWATAASTNSFSRSESTSPRIGRAM